MNLDLRDVNIPTLINACKENSQYRSAQAHISLTTSLNFNPETVSLSDAQQIARQKMREMLYGDIVHALNDAAILLKTEGRQNDGVAMLESLYNSLANMVMNGVFLPIGNTSCDGQQSSAAADAAPTVNTSEVPSGTESKTESEPSKVEDAPVEPEQSSSTTESTPSA